ncbi:MAG TPA: hypothetical protein VIM11_01115, partial [Tepidisphaeraceae bacterium]
MLVANMSGKVRNRRAAHGANRARMPSLLMRPRTAEVLFPAKMLTVLAAPATTASTSPTTAAAA